MTTKRQRHLKPRPQQRPGLQPDLLELYVAQLPYVPCEPGDHLTLTGELTGPPPDEVATDRIAVTATTGDGGDLIDFVADEVAYRALGLLVFAACFHGGRTVLHLCGGHGIDRLVIDCDADFAAPAEFDYRPVRPRTQHPFHYERRAEIEILPTLVRMRSAVHGFGEPEAASHLAALLLDLGLPDSERTQVILEGATGYQSVSARSAEARFRVGGAPVDLLW